MIPGTNIYKAPLTVKHSELERIDESMYRSRCPKCKTGVLMVMRDKDMNLMKTDHCMFCGQPFIYSDISGEKFI